MISRFLIVILLLSSTQIFSIVDLTTVPKRDFTQLTIYNSADITMVRERRTLTFKKGLNRLQFSWANTLIDPSSLRLTFKTKKSSLELLDTTFPNNTNNRLIWNIQSETVGSVEIEITYFTSGLTWRADYVAISNVAEDKIDITGYINVINNSGEDYPNAEIRLVVGTINLVETIRTLAKNKNLVYKKLDQFHKEEARKVILKTTHFTDKYLQITCQIFMLQKVSSSVFQTF